MCCEERFKNASLHLRGHPNARISHSEPHVLAWFGIRVPLGLHWTEANKRRVDFNCATAAYRITGVENEVDKGVLDDAVFGQNRGQVRTQDFLNRDPVSNEAFECLSLLLDHAVELDGLWPKRLASARSYQLASESCGTVDCSGDLGKLLCGFRIRRFARQQVGLSVNDRENVIEVMGKTACEPADGLGLVFPQNIHFLATPLGNILRHNQSSRAAAKFQIHRSELDLEHGEIFSKVAPNSAKLRSDTRF